MSSLYPKDWFQYLDILQVFFRLLGTFLLVPVFSHRAIPPRIKIMIALSISLAIYPILKPFLAPVPQELWALVVTVLRETIIGFLMGFSAYITFEAINLSAQFVGSQMGLGTTGLIDPQTQTQSSALVPLYGWVAVLIFLGLDLHYQWLQGVVLSFQWTHGLHGGDLFAKPVFTYYLDLTGRLFVLAIRMAAPFTLVLVATNITLGILGRLLPQMNLLFISFPITIMVGFGSLYLVAPEFSQFIGGILEESISDLGVLLKTI